MTLTLLALLLLMGPAAGAGDRKPVTYDGFLSLQVPAWSSRSGWGGPGRSTEIAGQLQLHHVLPTSPVSLVFTLNYDLGGWRSRFNVDDAFQAGMEVPFGREVTFFTYYDSEPALGYDRYWVGVRWNFSSD